MVAQMTNSSQMAASSSSWTKLEDKRFESALSESAYQTGSSEPNWETFNPMISGRDSLDLKKHFEMLVQDVASIEAGLVPMPDYADSLPSPSASEEAACESPKTRKAGSVGHVSSANGNHKGSSLSRTSEQERRKGVPWSEEEHKQFLLGLEKYGKGDWRSISRHFVISRTPTQVASHAQKYFIRLNSMNKDKRRSSIHDITSVDADPNNPPRAQMSHAGRPPTPIPIQGGQARGMVTTQQQAHIAPGYMTTGPSVFMPPPGLPPYPQRPRFHSRPVMSSSPVIMPYPMSQPALHQ